MKSIFLRFSLFQVVFLTTVCITISAVAQTTTGNLTVLRANGATNNAESVSIAEYSTSILFQSAPVTVANLPFTGAGPNLTVSGSAGSDGHMSLDSERTNLIIGGYNAVSGTSGVSSAGGINRCIFSLSPSGALTNVADVPQTTCFKTNNFRSATAAGNRYFGGGAGSSSTGGVQFMSGSSNTQVNTVILNARVVQIFNGQIYFSTNNTTPGIHSVGTGIPSTSGNATVQLPGVGSSSPYGFALSPDNNTLFVADDAAGILKYSRTGGAGTFSAPVTVSSVLCRGLTVDFTTTPYTIYATTSFLATSNALIRMIDGSATVDTLALAPANAFFKSVTFAPSAYAKIQGGGTTICSGSSDNIKFYGNPGDSITYTLNSVTNGIRLNNTGMAIMNTGALTAIDNDSVYTYSLVQIETSLGITPVSGSVSVTVNPSAPALIVGAASICNGSSLSLSSATLGGAWTSGATSVASINSSGFVTSTGSGNAVITYSLSNACGVISDTALIIVNATPSITITPVSATICNGSNTNITASGAATYTWTPSAGLSATTGATVNCNTTIARTYTVTGIALGCTGSNTQTIAVNPIPVLTVTPVSSTFCNGSNTNITASGATSYTWLPSSGLSATVGATVNCNATATTTYTISGTTAGCIGTATQLITVNPVPVLTVTPGAATICNGANTTIAASGATTYSWSPSTGLSATTGSVVNCSAAATTIYTITGTTAGCTGISTRTISVNPIPVLTITPTFSTICNGSSTSISVFGAFSFSWAPTTGLSTSVGSPISCNASATTTYTVTGTTAGCSGTATQTITVNPIPVLTVTPVSATICNGASTNITASGASSYSWSPSTGLSATTGATVNSSASATTVYTVTGTSIGCTGSTTQTITVNPVPVLTVTPVSSAICAGSNTNITATGAATYSWSPSSGLSATTGSVVNSTTAITRTYTVTGTASGCTGTALQTITVNPIPVLTVTPVSSTICNGSNTNITAAGATSFTWSPSTGLSTTAGSTVNSSPSGTTTYSVSGTTSGCTSTALQTITVNPVPSLTVTPASAAICNGSNTTITAAGATTYSWSPAAGLSSTTGASINCNASTTTTYTVNGTSLGCTGTATRTIVVNPIPVLTVTPVSSTFCSGSNTNIVAIGATTYSWSPSIGLSATTGSTVNSSAISSTTYTVSGSSAGCTGTASQVITVNPVPVLTVTPGASAICIGNATSISVSGAAGYVWSPSTGLSSTTASTVTCSPTVTTTYTVSGTSLGCTGTATQSITVSPLPNAGTITGSTIVCLTALTTLSNTATGGTWGSSAATIATVTGGVVLGIATGSTIISYTSANICGSVTDTMAITVYPQPYAGTITGTSVLCETTAITLSNSTAGGTWSSSSSSATVAGGVVSGISVGNAIISYSVTNICGTAVDTMSVTINPLADATIYPGAATICVGSMITLSGSLTGGTWSTSSAAIALTGNVVTGVNTGTAVITYAVSSTCGADTGFAIVNVDIMPVVDLIFGDNNICVGETTVFTEAVPGGTWSSSNASVASVSGSSVFGVSAGVATITYMITNACGSAITSKAITVHSLTNCNTGIVSTKEGAEEINIYPNPNKGSFIVRLPQTANYVTISIVDLVGKVIATLTDTNQPVNEIPVSLDNVTDGIYLVIVEVNDKRYRLKMVVR